MTQKSCVTPSYLSWYCSVQYITIVGSPFVVNPIVSGGRAYKSLKIVNGNLCRASTCTTSMSMERNLQLNKLPIVSDIVTT